MAADDTLSSRTRIKCEDPLSECVIVVDAGPDAGRRFGNLSHRMIIGQDSSCDICLSDPHVAPGPYGHRL